jgi:hypothetical protein
MRLFIKLGSASCALVVLAAAPALASSRAPAAAGHLHLKVERLQRPCHTRRLVGSFVITHLKKGAYQIEASNGQTSGPLIYNGKAKRSHVKLTHVTLKYQFPKGEPTPTSVTVSVNQGARQPSNATTMTLGACHK